MNANVTFNFCKSEERGFSKESLENEIEVLVDNYHSGSVDKETCRQTYLEKVWAYYTKAYFSSVAQAQKFAEKYDVECMTVASNCLERYNGEGNFIHYLNFSMKRATLIPNDDKRLYSENESHTFDRVVIYENEFGDSEDSDFLDSIEDYSMSPDFVMGFCDARILLAACDRVYLTQQARVRSYISHFLTNALYEALTDDEVEYSELKKYHFFDGRLYSECCRKHSAFKSNELASLAGMAPSNYCRAIKSFICKVKDYLAPNDGLAS